MSATQFKNDLTQPGVKEEPRASSNAGMNVALILTVVLSLVFVLWAIAVGSKHDSSRVISPSEQFNGQMSSPKAPSKTSHTTYFNGKQVHSDNDKSFVDGTETQAAPPSPNIQPEAQN